MNPGFPTPPNAPFEARVTALLLGELSPDEAAEVKRLIELDPDLSRLHEQLQKTIGLVRQTSAPRRISAHKREQLLQRFKTVTPTVFAGRNNQELAWYIPMGIAAVLVVAIGSMVFWITFAARPMEEMLVASSKTKRLREPFRTERTHIVPTQNAAIVKSRNANFENERLAERGGEIRRETAPSNDQEQRDRPETLPLSDQSTPLIITGGSARSLGGSTATIALASPERPNGSADSAKKEVAENEFAYKGQNRRGEPKFGRADLAAGGGFGGGGGLGGGLGGGGAAGFAFNREDLSAQAASAPSTTGSVIERKESSPVYRMDPELMRRYGLAPNYDAPVTEPHAVGETQVATQSSSSPTPAAGPAVAVNGIDPVTRQPLPPPPAAEIWNASALASEGSDLLALQPTKPSVASKPDITSISGRATSAPVSHQIASFDANGGTQALSLGKNFAVVSDLDVGGNITKKASGNPGEISARRDTWQKDLKDANASPSALPSLGTTSRDEKNLLLGELLKTRESLSQRFQSEQSEKARAAGDDPVRIVKFAEAGPDQSSTFWSRLQGTATGTTERAARIVVDKDRTDISPLLMGVQQPQSYDPYFIQAEFEKIKSKAVLYKAIEKLNLNETWGATAGAGDKLNTAETYQRLLNRIDVRQAPNTNEIEIKVKSEKPEEAAQIANTIAEVYQEFRKEKTQQAGAESLDTLKRTLEEQEQKIARAKDGLEQLKREASAPQPESAKPAAPGPTPQPEVLTHENAFSTFSLNVTDVSFQLAAASLEKGAMPDPGTVRSEEFLNAFDYRDSEPPPGVPIAFAWERAKYPFAHNRDLLRLSVKTGAEGRAPGRPMNLVLLLDNSGSMERADRVQIIRECLRVLAAQLQPHDKLSVIAFARNARLWVDGISGPQAGQAAEQLSTLSPEGGTNIEEAMQLGYETARRHYFAGGVNRLVLLTDGAANLGNLDPDALKRKVEENRKEGFALDCFGIGWDGYNDDLIEVLSRNGDGRYGFINTPEQASSEFAGKLAGALRVAASDVKVQVEFNAKRVTAYRQIGYAKHQLTKEQFRDNAVDAAELGAAESGNALYVLEVNAQGEGPLGVVRVRFKQPETGEYREHEWAVPYNGAAPSLEHAPVAMRLAATASAFSEWLASSPYATEVIPQRLLGYVAGVPEVYGADPRPRKLEWMIRQAQAITGR